MSTHNLPMWRNAGVTTHTQKLKAPAASLSVKLIPSSSVLVEIASATRRRSRIHRHHTAHEKGKFSTTLPDVARIHRHHTALERGKFRVNHHYASRRSADRDRGFVVVRAFGAAGGVGSTDQSFCSESNFRRYSVEIDRGISPTNFKSESITSILRLRVQ